MDCRTILATKYKTGDIVFPSAIGRMLGISVAEAYHVLEGCKNDALVKVLYMMRCPLCGTIFGHRLYSLNEVTEYIENCYGEIACEHCDQYFVPKIDDDIVVYYEKM